MSETENTETAETATLTKAETKALLQQHIEVSANIELATKKQHEIAAKLGEVYGGQTLSFKGVDYHVRNTKAGYRLSTPASRKTVKL